VEFSRRITINLSVHAVTVTEEKWHSDSQRDSEVEMSTRHTAKHNIAVSVTGGSSVAECG